MYAVIQSGGKQYIARPGQDLKVEKLPGTAGDPVAFDRVLLTSDGEKVSVGSPYLENTKVTGRITRQDKDRKIVVFKYKRRKDYKVKRGHRQPFTMVRIEAVQGAGE